jgi:hypothetical protein
MKLFSEKESWSVWWICLLAIAIIFLNVARSLPQFTVLLMSGDGDDLMRLQQVRDWLAGQSWFDTQQYRVLPPEGISIHWSRYVDIGIAAFLVPASWMLPISQAELAAVILWPTLLGCLTVLVIGHGANRLMGTAAAIGALVTFLTWGKLGGEFTAGRIDHHNIQILCATAILYLSLVPGRRQILGALAGALTAFSLAIGLEMLPFLAINWGMMVLRHAFDEDGVDKWLLGFCASFAVSAPLLLAGQTPRSGWWINHCDVLAPPVLALATVGILATLAPVFLARTIPHPVNRILVSAAITACGLWLASPLLAPCLAGPYAESSPEVRTIIETQVTEALSASLLLQTGPELLLRVLMPAVVIAILALITAVLTWDRLSKTLRIALIQSFVVLLVGLAFAFVQIRAANLMTPAVPLLAGFLFHSFIRIPRDSPLRAPAALILLLSMPTVVEAAGRTIAGPPTSPPSAADISIDPQTAQSVSYAYCRNETALAEIASLPKSVVFSSLNLGPAIVVYTHHAVTSAGYHRSTEAFRNGAAAFRGRTDLRNGLASSGADYLVICARALEERVISKLMDDGWPDWLIEVTGDRNQVRVFKVDKLALAEDHSGF